MVKKELFSSSNNERRWTGSSSLEGIAALEAGALGAGEGGWVALGQLGGCEDRFRRWILKVTIATSGN
jgi:hypothetical protein